MGKLGDKNTDAEFRDVDSESVSTEKLGSGSNPVGETYSESLYSPSKGIDVVVWYDGSEYHADGPGGPISVSPSAHSVIQSSLDEGPSTTVSLSFDSATLDAPLEVMDNHTLIGNGVELTASGDHSIIQPKSPTSFTFYVYVSGVKLAGTGTTTPTEPAIDATRAQHWTIERPRLDNWPVGVLFDGGDGGAYNNSIIQPDTRYNDNGCGTGIKFTTTGTTKSNQNQIIGGRVALCDIGIDNDSGTTNTVSEVNLADNSTHIRQNSDVFNVSNCRIEFGDTGVLITTEGHRTQLIGTWIAQDSITTPIDDNGKNTTVIQPSSGGNRIRSRLTVYGNQSANVLLDPSATDDTIEYRAANNFNQTFRITNTDNDRDYIAFNRFGRPQLPNINIFTETPTLSDMEDGEMALGQGTGPGGENEFLAKRPDGASIYRLFVDGTITE